MLRAPVVGVMVGSLLVVASQSLPLSVAGSRLPTPTCVDATMRTVDARIDPLRDAIDSVGRGGDPRSLPHAPSHPRLAACGVR